MGHVVNGLHKLRSREGTIDVCAKYGEGWSTQGRDSNHDGKLYR